MQEILNGSKTSMQKILNGSKTIMQVDCKNSWYRFHIHQEAERLKLNHITFLS